MVGLCGFLVMLEGFTQDKLVVVSFGPEGVIVDCPWVEKDIGVLAFSLSGTAAVKVPNWQLYIGGRLEKIARSGFTRQHQ